MLPPPRSKSATSARMTVVEVLIERATRLREARVHDFVEGDARVRADVFADAVEDDDSVVDAEADDGEEAGDEHAVDLRAEELAEDGEGAEDEDGVVQGGDDGGDAVAVGLWHVAERHGDI